MQVKLVEWQDADDEYHERLFINGKWRQSVGPLCDCPEDAIIGRALVSCGDIVACMREAYEAGKVGEPFEVVTETKEPED